MPTSHHNLGISLKILLVSLCFFIPITVLAYFVFYNIDDNINFARLEITGNAYQRPVESLLRDVGEHQRLVHRCPADGNCSVEIQALGKDIADEIETLKQVDEKLGALLQFTPEGLAKRKREIATVIDLEKNWRAVTAQLELSRQGGTPPASIDDKYASVNNILNMMITHLGDISNLILDPELDTYHLMADTLLTLPQNQNRLSNMIALARDAYAHHFKLEDRMALAAAAAELQDMDITQANNDTNTALNENQNEFHEAQASLQQSIPPLLKKLVGIQPNGCGLNKTTRHI